MRIHWKILIIGLVCFLILSNPAMAASTGPESPAPDDSLLSYKRITIAGVLGFSFLIGAFGASCYYMGVYFGFIDRAIRSKILEFLLSKDPDQNPKVNYSFFCFLGGVVAMVFQAAQVDTLTPIQAFVLGATWPSVVNRMITGSNSSTAAQIENLIRPGADVPAPKSDDAPRTPREIKLS